MLPRRLLRVRSRDSTLCGMRTLIWIGMLALVVRAADVELDRAVRALRTAPRSGRERAVRAVLTLRPDRADLVARLRESVDVKSIGSGWHLLSAVARKGATDKKGVRRPFHLYVPEGLTKPAPLLVHMHGGVSRPEFNTEPRGVGSGRLWTPLADEHKFVVVYPCARRDCVWWTDAGIAHVRAVIREVKRLAPIDDDSIVGTGFSDGASGCYHLAMAAPDPFAAFIPMNGHPAVPANLSGRQLYLRNLVNVPLFVASTSNDPLYPGAAVLKHTALALQAGASIRMVNYESGSHTPVYFEEQAKAFVGFLEGKLRDGDAFEISWECADRATGRCRWVEVLDIDGGLGELGGAKARPDLNVTSTPGRVRLGIQVDRAFAGPGVRVTGVTNNSTAAAAGLQKNDVVLILNGIALANLNDLIAGLHRANHGDAVKLTVARGDQTVELAGQFAPFTARPYYVRDKPTALAHCVRRDDRIAVRTRHVKRLRLWLHETPPQVQLIDAPGAVVDVRELALEDIVRAYARDADSGTVYTAVATLTWKAKP